MAPIIADGTRQAVGGALLKIEQVIRGILLIAGHLTLLVWDVLAGGFTIVWFLEVYSGALAARIATPLGFGLSAGSSAVQIVLAHRIKNKTIKGVNPFILVIAITWMIVDTMLDLIGSAWFFGRVEPTAFSWSWLASAPVALRLVIIFATMAAALQEYLSTMLSETLAS